MNTKFNELFKEGKVALAVHRGAFGGNIIQNTAESFLLSKQMGGDIFELDASLSTDGVLYAFHDGNEKGLFGMDKNIQEMSSKEIEDLVYVNSIGEPSGKKVERLEKTLLGLKGHGFINLDRSWNFFDKVVPLAKELDMLSDIIFKSPATDEALEYLEGIEDKVMFMPIIKTKEELDKYLASNLNIVAVEIIFQTEEDELVSSKVIEDLKERGIKIWFNSICLGDNVSYNLAANKHDDLALSSPSENWGWLVERGCDIIQTDWPFFLKNYLNKIGM